MTDRTDCGTLVHEPFSTSPAEQQRLLLRETALSSQMTDSPSNNIEPMPDRDAEFEQWCRDVRDPAELHAEGLRVIRAARGGACVEYEIAPLPDGAWAVRWWHQFLCGDYWGVTHPWTRCANRQECLELVLRTSRQMFAPTSVKTVQQPIRREMSRLLGEGLFGFIEPEPTNGPSGEL